MTTNPRFDDTPLTDEEYEPQHRPINGKPNPIVARWGPRSQVRWFARFWGSAEMPRLYWADVADLHCSSVEHKGPCCESCADDREMGFDDLDDHCCCRALQ